MTGDAIRLALRANPWFAELPPAAIDRMTSMAQRRAYEDGGLIHAKGDEPNGLLGLLSGTVKISSTLPDGREAVLTYLEPGHWFGEISLFDGQPRTHDARSAGRTDLLLLPRPAFNAMLAEMPALYPHFLRLLCQRLRTAFIFIEDSTLLPLSARLAKRLLQLAATYGLPRGDHVLINLHLPQEELGTMLGISRQTVNKELKSWQRQGWLRVDYGRLLIQPDALRALIARAEQGA
jgi:CRP-like cAMP-binding protein